MTDRPALTRERIVAAAVAVADEGGLTAASMRNVGKQLGVEAMSLYHHVASKSALLDALADWIFAQIELPEPGTPWRPAMQARAASARSVLAAHPWALGLIESRPDPGPALLTHHNAVLGCLRGNGFTVALALQAFSAIDSYVYGFVLTELNLPFQTFQGAWDVAISMDPPAAEYPHLTEVMSTVVSGAYTYTAEFDNGLELILDGLERRLAEA
ncbi:TetR/AcrR family transcriptional regulator [Ruania alkalisoli]|uniref:TetR/AcrR family transcriptional regulator n=1 Tax=Ruania alkalisoli TaxID=2779775 RepID=A0A7M1SQR9_9MICO|nr:TetR/AcrR family transcriptional regulator [Ruania alkalisoli]QOR69344.1 TetR/AcrR family transcriptional regulator [Ruania alkalisoli]